MHPPPSELPRGPCGQMPRHSGDQNNNLPTPCTHGQRAEQSRLVKLRPGGATMAGRGHGRDALAACAACSRALTTARPLRSQNEGRGRERARAECCASGVRSCYQQACCYSQPAGGCSGKGNGIGQHPDWAAQGAGQRASRGERGASLGDKVRGLHKQHRRACVPRRLAFSKQ